MVALIILFVIESIPIWIGYFIWKKKWKKISFLVTSIGVAFLLMQISVVYNFYTEKNIARYYQSTKELLTHDANYNFTYFYDKGTDWERGLMATSWFAESLSSYAKVKPTKKDEIVSLLVNACAIVNSKEISTCDSILSCQEGLYLAHTLIVLQSYKQVAQQNQFDTLSLEIAVRLASLMKKAPTFNAPSYGSMTDRWTGDNSTILHALKLYDDNNKTSIHQDLLKQWKAKILKNYTDINTTLPLSELQNIYNWSKYPRGSSIAYTVRYLSDVDNSFAQSIWTNYKKHYQIDLGLIVLFREYPKNISFVDDYDSGLSFYGIGAAATGNAITASASLEDSWTFWRLQNTLWGGYIVIKLFPSLFATDIIGNEADGFMANSLYFWACTYYYSSTNFSI